MIIRIIDIENRTWVFDHKDIRAVCLASEKIPVSSIYLKNKIAIMVKDRHEFNKAYVTLGHSDKELEA